jgi:hypothetical protein
MVRESGGGGGYNYSVSRASGKDGACTYNCNSQAYSLTSLVRRNTLAVSEAVASQSNTELDLTQGNLRRVLGWSDLVAYGISATRGSGM